MRYIKTFLCLILLSTIALSQSDVRSKGAKQLIFDRSITQAEAAAYPQKGNAVLPSPSFVTWRVIDSMSNILGYMEHAINPYSYDPDLNILALAHRGDGTSYAPTTGGFYYSISTNGGTVWDRSTIMNAFDDPIAARYPSGTIFNPTGAQGDAYFFSAYPNLYGDPPSEFGDMGAAYDYPLGDLLAPTSQRYTHTDTSQFAVPNQTWASKTHMLWANTLYGGGSTGTYKGVVIARTTDFSLFPTPLVIGTTDTMNTVNSFSQLGGDAINVGAGSVTAYGIVGNFYRVYHDNIDSAILTGLTVGVIYSTNNGATWSDFDTVNLASLAPDLGVYTHLGEFTASSFDIAGDLLLDSAGYPHIAIGLQEQEDGSAGTNMVIGELYKNGSGWHGKIVGALNSSTLYDYGGQQGYHPTMARNKQGTVFAVQYVHSNLPSNIPDLWVSSRKWTANNWSPIFNATETPTRGEAYSHLAPRLRPDGGSLYTLFSTYAFWSDSSHYQNDEDCSPCRTILYGGEIPVSSATISFNYAALAWTYPIPGYTITIDSSLSNLKSTVKNSGEETPTDNFTVKLRILNSSGTELATETQNLPFLTTGETRTVNWVTGFVPPGLGEFRFQTIVKTVSDLFATDDTNTIFVKVVEPAIITKVTIQKLAQPYVEIVPDTVYAYDQSHPEGPKDDDHQEFMALPFKFFYNGNTYDSVQFAINGWLQLGKAGYGRDSTFGLADSDQIAYNQNSRGFAALTPVNSFGPWWEDLKIDAAQDPEASVSMATVGDAPNRVFVVQWKHMLAYFDSELTDVRINFQARLYESSSIIEFHYGPVTGTLFGGSDTGAMISLKDDVGGDYHFMDVYQGKSGQVRNGNTTLNPLEDWPGPDSMYRIYPSYVEVTASVGQRWNLISNPLFRLDNSVASMFPTATNTYQYNPPYAPSSTLIPGRGYWAKFPSATSVTYGGHQPHATVANAGIAGWNLVGAHSVAVPAPSGGIISSAFYGYNNGYQQAATLQPGQGYWVKTSSAGSFALAPGGGKVAAENWAEYNSITITDKLGRSQQLYVAEDAKGSMDLGRYEMPPVPPQGEFDARFKTSRILETFVPTDNVAEFPIVMQSPEYPLQVAFNANNGTKGLQLLEVANGKVVATHQLNGIGRVTIASGNANSLVLKVSELVNMPKEFALGQNYPNPFNPTTRLAIEMPQDARIEVVVYDILGRQVKTLLNEVKPAGYHSVEWDATNDAGISVPSGTYFVRMTSEKFTSVRKMMLLK
jgi:hypothetical protein